MLNAVASPSATVALSATTVTLRYNLADCPSRGCNRSVGQFDHVIKLIRSIGLGDLDLPGAAAGLLAKRPPLLPPFGSSKMTLDVSPQPGAIAYPTPIRRVRWQPCRMHR
jgi:hypothetical protein